MSNKYVTPSKDILILDIQIKTRCVKRLKYNYISKCLQFHRWSINIKNLQCFTINAKKRIMLGKRLLLLLAKTTKSNFNSLDALQPLWSVDHFLQSSLQSSCSSSVFISDTNVFLNYIYTETFPVKFFAFCSRNWCLIAPIKNSDYDCHVYHFN